MSFWNYRGRCIGRVIHFLYHYAGMDVAEHATIGGDCVEYHGKPFARFTWSDRFGRCDVPEFTFLDDAEGRFAAAQESKAGRAIVDGCIRDVPADGRVPVEAAALRVIQREAAVSASIYFGLVHNVSPDYYVHGSRLLAEGNGWIYAWEPTAKGWMLWIEGERHRPAALDTSAEASLP
jgi:hypothetical protein